MYCSYLLCTDDRIARTRPQILYYPVRRNNVGTYDVYYYTCERGFPQIPGESDSNPGDDDGCAVGLIGFRAALLCARISDSDGRKQRFDANVNICFETVFLKQKPARIW